MQLPWEIAAFSNPYDKDQLSPMEASQSVNLPRQKMTIFVGIGAGIEGLFRLSEPFPSIAIP